MPLDGDIGTSNAIAYHDALAAGWEGRYAGGGFQRRAAFFERTIAPHLALAGRTWIDVGCGSGHFSRWLAGAGARVTGVDGSAAMIAEARRLADGEGRNGPAFSLVPTVERLDNADASVEGCLCLSVLEYLDAPERCLAEMARVTRPGGQVVVSAPNRRSVVRRVQGAAVRLGLVRAGYLASSRASWTARELDELAAACGLARQFAAGFDALLPRPAWAVVATSLRFVIWTKPVAAAGAHA